MLILLPAFITVLTPIERFPDLGFEVWDFIGLNRKVFKAGIVGSKLYLQLSIHRQGLASSRTKPAQK